MTKRGEIERALAAVDRTTEEYLRTKQEHETARAASIKAALHALRIQAGPAEVARRSPFEAAYLRRIAREQGIPPAREPKRPAPE